MDEIGHLGTLTTSVLAIDSKTLTSAVAAKITDVRKDFRFRDFEVNTVPRAAGYMTLIVFKGVRERTDADKKVRVPEDIN